MLTKTCKYYFLEKIMRNVLLITMFIVAAFIVGDYVQVIQTSEAG